MKRIIALAALGLVVALVLPRVAAAQFDHQRHAALFSDCAQCHAGAAEAGAALFPAPSFCGSCHNGQMQPRVSWAGYEAAESGLRFSHDAHPRLGCENCHNPSGAERMEVQRTVPDRCMACHAGGAGHFEQDRDACGTCHVQLPRPSSHTGTFTELHGAPASTAPNTCASCHIRQDCLDCHRPNPASFNGYHPGTFLTQHASAAYQRQTSCSDCHNTAQFCSDCHRQAGLVARRGLQRGFHDGNSLFAIGHGQAARQSLETCVSCHTENDCLSCHSAGVGLRINPHGPDFDAEKLREKNAQMCTVCHGAVIPNPGANRP